MLDGERECRDGKPECKAKKQRARPRLHDSTYVRLKADRCKGHADEYNRAAFDSGMPGGRDEAEAVGERSEHEPGDEPRNDSLPRNRCARRPVARRTGDRKR